ncbi:MAG: 2Fe-2S iron-sulfur cluster-binding protein [Synergistetes bacterium]|nr:2Fe-2S iron-sulfur cluster-binding protein [Synergistota bacterium]MCX8128105.1 2Fe-2S iron-sulfur cluster-binding protein [Synergistota bacterium]MDW8192481.1 2Fe-2S iron-sulfur cluster-binding protein [Synergistota bacterium]
MQKVKIKLNGNPYEIEVKPYETLLDILLRLGIISSHKSWCNKGECGNCVVLIDGRPFNSCLVLAPEVNGKDILTITKESNRML